MSITVALGTSLCFLVLLSLFGSINSDSVPETDVIRGAIISGLLTTTIFVVSITEFTLFWVFWFSFYCMID